MPITPVTELHRTNLWQAFCAENPAQAEWFLYCCDETAKGRGLTLVAHDENGRPQGFASLLFQPSYEYLGDVPELHGMAVLPSCHRRGTGRALLAAAEEAARHQGFHQLGLGVGVTADYQPAMRLYLQSGYLPDGRGLYQYDCPGNFPARGDQITINNSTSLWFIKRLV